MTDSAQPRPGAAHSPADQIVQQHALQFELVSESSVLLMRVTALARVSAGQLSALSLSLTELGACNPRSQQAPSAAALAAAAAAVRANLLPLVATATRMHALIGSLNLADQPWRQPSQQATLYSLTERMRRLAPQPAVPEDLRCVQLMLDNLAAARCSVNVVDSVIGEALAALRAAQAWGPD